MSRIEHLTMKARDAIAMNGTGGMSTGEALAVALVLNRSDWLAKMDYTIAEALNRIDDDWIAIIPQVARSIDAANVVMAQANVAARDAVALSDLTAGAGEIDLEAKLVTYGNAPGYRDMTFTFDLQRHDSASKQRVRLQVSAEDSASMVEGILHVHRFAWSEDGPIDKLEGERRPRWIDAVPR